MGVTQVTASERDQRWASARARYLDAQHFVLAATSLVAVLAIALSLTGRRAADAFAGARESQRSSLELSQCTIGPHH